MFLDARRVRCRPAWRRRGCTRCAPAWSRSRRRWQPSPRTAGRSLEQLAESPARRPASRPAGNALAYRALLGGVHVTHETGERVEEASESAHRSVLPFPGASRALVATALPRLASAPDMRARQNQREAHESRPRRLRGGTGDRSGRPRRDTSGRPSASSSLARTGLATPREKPAARAASAASGRVWAAATGRPWWKTTQPAVTCSERARVAAERDGAQPAHSGRTDDHGVRHRSPLPSRSLRVALYTGHAGRTGHGLERAHGRTSPRGRHEAAGTVLPAHAR